MKVGVFGGSFNPIHTGHAIIAGYVAQHCQLDKVLLMVSPLNPFKASCPEAVSDIHRLRMAELVSRNLPKVYTSAFEFGLPKPSYTIDTLNALQAKFPDDELYLIIGADNWRAWDKWRDHDEILRKYHLIVYPRLGHEVTIPQELAHRVTLADAPIIEISSSHIRAELQAGRDVCYWVPAEVYQYIRNNHLYEQE